MTSDRMLSQMVAKTAAYLNELDHLPVGTLATWFEVPWEDYEQLLLDASERRGVRVFYDRGRLEAMTLSWRHELYSGLIHMIVHALSDKYAIESESGGATTLIARQLKQGAEPDESFYVGNTQRIIGKSKIDLTVDPPPDLVVEIDVSNDSSRKLDFYSAIGIPEVWICDDHYKVRFFSLGSSGYEIAKKSASFPCLTTEALADFLEFAATHGQSASLRRFRDWLSQQATQIE